MGACVNVTEADWAWVDNSFNLSVPAIPGKCGPDCPDSYCVCLKKKELCADQGCSSFFGGFGFASMLLTLNFRQRVPTSTLPRADERTFALDAALASRNAASILCMALLDLPLTQLGQCRSLFHW